MKGASAPMEHATGVSPDEHVRSPAAATGARGPRGLGDRSIVVEELSKHYGDLRAVDEVSLEIPSGEVFGFLGPNGAGKTTLIKMLATILAPTSGRAEVGGHDVVLEAGLVRRAIGVALQEVGLDPLMTARELLTLQGRLFGMRGSDAAVRADCLLELVGLEDVRRKKRVGQFSGGMKRRLDLALALVHGPRILFLDEPTTGLDPVSRVGIWDEVRRLNRDEGMTVFLTTQYLEEADRLADRVAIINLGSIVALGSPARLKEEIGEEVATVNFESSDLAERGARALVQVAPRNQVSGNDVLAYFPVAANAIPQLVRALDAAGVPFTGLNVRQPTLDDVFLRTTGERMSVGSADLAAAVEDDDGKPTEEGVRR
jgi:ABC-2 type transport system ATP-binding protein